MSYAAGALPLGVLITLDELEITLEKGVDNFPIILLPTIIIFL